MRHHDRCISPHACAFYFSEYVLSDLCSHALDSTTLHDGVIIPLCGNSGQD
jgi:hypothetical protein